MRVTNAPVGEHVRVAIAMVDEGILSITQYESPNPVNYFFGRRALGVDMRDDYGRLLNPNLGAPATARQGGDSIGGEGLTVVPTRTVAIVLRHRRSPRRPGDDPGRYSGLQRHAAADGGGVERERARAGRRTD